MHLPRVSGLVTLLTDFGHADPYVGIMKGVIKQHDPKAEVLDLCHEVPAQDVTVGGFFLSAAAGRFPRGTVHVAVVDPGVGTDRRVLAALARDCYWLAPDNGLLGPLLAEVEELRSVNLGALGLRAGSRTFHGRDLFAPLAGMLSSARYGFRALGGRCDDPDPGPPAPDQDRVLHVDHFGNLVTTIRAESLRAAGPVTVRVKDQEVPVHRTYAEVPAGSLLALVNSYDLLEIAVNGGSAAERLGVSAGETVELVR